MKSLNSIWRSVFLILFVTRTIISHGQFQDDFSDGNFTSNPIWSGSDSIFLINSGRLKLQAYPVAAKAFLSTPSSAIHNASWEFYVQLDFNPSSTNFANVYLVSDQQDLTLPLNGYYVMIGNTADEISLYRQSGTTKTLVIDGANGRVNLSSVKVWIRTTRDDLGNWTLYSDTIPTNPTRNYKLEGTFNNQTHTVSSFFGVQCTYSSTRSDKFWFDDFVVTGTPVPDLTPPVVSEVQVANQNSILIFFNEALDPVTAQNTSNYTISNNIGSPSTANLQPDSKSVLLTWPTSLTNGLTYTLQVSGVQDVKGNGASSSFDFLYFVSMPVGKKDIIVSEFMADPTPVIGLPETEFVELLNRSPNPIDLQGWKLSDGSVTAVLPHFILLPASRCVVAPNSAAGLFANALGVSNFPSLNNTGDNIIVKNPVGLSVDSITYSQGWYHSDEKKDGGWSLEIIDPENLCEEEDNWTASVNNQGGTPGLVNSVLASNPDVTPPVMVSATIVSPTSIEITFNEKLDGNGQVTASVEPAAGFVSVNYSGFLRKILLTTSQLFQPSAVHTLTLSNVYDCSGNPLVNTSIQIVLPEKAEPGDILINEVLFNPKTGGVDFVEVFNNTGKHISLKKWFLSNFEGDTTVNAKEITGTDLIFAPHSFRVFTTDPLTLKAHYPRTIENVCVATSMPPMSDDEGSIALTDSLGNVVDYFLYKEKYHVVFLKDKEGISLERVSFDVLTNDANNWRSASQVENFATPGYRNSVFTDGLIAMEGEVLAEPEIFSPQSPPNDFTKIIYRFDQSGYVANAFILDQQGRLIKELANNEVLGTEGFFRWDGDRDDGGRARAGYYVAWVEVFRSSGQIKTFRKRVVITYR